MGGVAIQDKDTRLVVVLQVVGDDVAIEGAMMSSRTTDPCMKDEPVMLYRDPPSGPGTSTQAGFNLLPLKFINGGKHIPAALIVCCEHGDIFSVAGSLDARSLLALQGDDLL